MNGLVARIFAAPEVAKLAAAIERNATLTGPALFYSEKHSVSGQFIRSRIEAFVDHDETLGALVTNAAIQSVVERMLGQRAVLFKDKANFNEPGSAGFRPHQDVQAGWLKYARNFVSVLVAVDAHHARNGDFQVHRGNALDSLIGSEFEPLSDGDIRDLSFETCELAPGEAVFFDGYLPHRSGPNLSSESRRNIILTFNAALAGDHRAQYFSDKRKSFPPDRERVAGHEYRFRV